MSVTLHVWVIGSGSKGQGHVTHIRIDPMCEVWESVSRRTSHFCPVLDVHVLEEALFPHPVFLFLSPHAPHSAWPSRMCAGPQAHLWCSGLRLRVAQNAQKRAGRRGRG